MISTRFSKISDQCLQIQSDFWKVIKTYSFDHTKVSEFQSINRSILLEKHYTIYLNTQVCLEREGEWDWDSLIKILIIVPVTWWVWAVFLFN